MCRAKLRGKLGTIRVDNSPEYISETLRKWTQNNKITIQYIQPAVGGDYQIFDADVRGFAVCIYQSGGRAFTIDYRLSTIAMPGCSGG